MEIYTFIHTHHLYRLCNSDVVSTGVLNGVSCIKNDNDGKQFHSRKNRIRKCTSFDVAFVLCHWVLTVSAMRMWIQMRLWVRMGVTWWVRVWLWCSANNYYKLYAVIRCVYATLLREKCVPLITHNVSLHLWCRTTFMHVHWFFTVNIRSIVVVFS